MNIDEINAVLEVGTKEQKDQAYLNLYSIRNWRGMEHMVSHGYENLKNPYPLISHAIEEHDLDALEQIRQLGHHLDQYESLSIMSAADAGSIEILVYLKSHGCNIHINDDAALIPFVRKGDIKGFRTLVRWGLNPLREDNSLLVMAIENGHTSLAMEILATPGIELVDERGDFRPVRAAIKFNDEQVGSKLLEMLSNDMDDVMHSLNENHAYLPEDWYRTVESWQLRNIVA